MPDKQRMSPEQGSNCTAGTSACLDRALDLEPDAETKQVQHVVTDATLRSEKAFAVVMSALLRNRLRRIARGAERSIELISWLTKPLHT